ncbi:hypothetical protein PF005_g28673 [Phytophthora fragariae]|uniref:RxLR effector protein n=1 Tax=Phytophthora fragariae TaxID=53985 RepID=A0A6A3R2R6_9STRA|nr:hypothetical protein PF009_g26829 [Phytophthora fragariae]KAE8974090.1 hypothetical protein PF011_g24996 [Phytophthora fragariae]KAE9063880.1 hypothetical protein PF010_g28822 [Phytophthora fragariae]KAE9072512.1 hypothetical protein PF007_g26149 [Phytophthora fragariae]KAE9088605.1 hypothetical protein PF006_g25541 [Phytophthora fragariae]
MPCSESVSSITTTIHKNKFHRPTMRLQSVLLLAAAAILVSVDATATTDLKTTQARSLTSTGRDAAGERLLNTAAKISTKASTTKVASKVAVMDDQLDDVLAKLPLDDAFTKLKLNGLIDKPDELFTSPNFMRWFNHMTRANEVAKTKGGMTVTKFLREKQGDEAVAQMLAQASMSEIPAVKKMGSGLQIDHLNQMMKARKHPNAVDKISTLSTDLKTQYRTLWDAAIAKAAANRAKDLLRAKERAKLSLRV